MIFCLQEEVAHALGLLNDDADSMPRATRQAAPEADAVRRPGHTKKPYVADDTGASGGEVHDTDDDRAEEEPKAKRRRPTSAADSVAAPGADLA